MNFIEAWKKANGKKIEVGRTIINTKKSITEQTEILSELELLSDYWNIVKETKVIWTVTYISDGFYFASTFSDRTNMETWKENNKSRTRIIGVEKYIDEY